MQLQNNVSLKPYNTFGIDVSAKYFSEAHSINELKNLIAEKIFVSEKHIMLGGGSNVLFTKNFDGLVIKNAVKGIEVIIETDKDVTVKASAGEVWHQLVLWCIERNYGGLENLSLIPGCVGAAPMQNIGAYGIEVKDVFQELEALNIETGELVKFNLRDCEFGYRESVFKNKYRNKFFIISVTFLLKKFSPEKFYRFNIDYGDIKHTLSEMQAYDLTPRAVSDAVCKIRSSKLPDPAVLGNAGSFFKNPVITKEKFEELIAANPVMPNYPLQSSFIPSKSTAAYKIPAGWLIEQCGWKGKVVGNTGSHKSQALVLVNYGNATGSEIWDLAMQIQQSVKEKFGVEIIPEVNVV
jgi:UDP-N-acetylmuramate dehydrogenase